MKKIKALLLMIGTVGLAAGFMAGTAHASTPYYTKSINSSVSYIKGHTKKSELNCWDALAVKRSPHGMSSAAKKVFAKSLAGQFKDLDGHYAAVDYERTLIGAVSMGYNPTKYRGKNLVNGIIKTAPKSNAGVLAKVFGIIALSTKNYGSKSNATIKTLVSQVVKAQDSKGGWEISGHTSDVDVTGMALMALGMHKNYSGVNTAISKAVRLLETKAFSKKTGDFVIAGSFSKKANANSDALAIAGLSAVGVNPEKLKTKSGVTPIKRLIKYQKSSGQFRWWMGSNSGSLQMATQQSAYALEQYSYFKANKGSIFKF